MEKKTTVEPISATNARALRLFSARLESLFRQMEHGVEFGQIVLTQNFEEGRAVNLCETNVRFKDKL